MGRWIGVPLASVILMPRPWAQKPPAVTAPPESFFEKFAEKDREAARKFYKKYLDVKGLSVVAAGEVADEALQRTHDIVTHMLAGRPDILEAMAKHGTRLIIIGKDQVYTDMPEYRNHPNPTYQNERVRGTGGLGVTSFGEENLLNLPIDRYDDESIAVHEFCHTIDAALRPHRPRAGASASARPTGAPSTRGCGRTPTPRRNQAEYWAEICQSYFDCNRVNNWNHGPIATREQLKQYDPDGYELVRDDVQADARERLALPAAAPAAERHRRRRRSSRSTRTTPSSPTPASSRCSGRSTSATRRCSRPTTRSARCSPTGTTSSRR